MRHWFTRRDLPLRTTTIKRFEPSHWTVDFPRGCMASVVSIPDRNDIEVAATFARKDDLVGLIYTSEDLNAHVGHQRKHCRDYSRCTLRFHWQSSGVISLDQPNGPTLTVEGEDDDGNQRSWFVRLWNYAQGTGSDAVITLSFDALYAGYSLPTEAERIDPRAISRMFISLVPPGFDPGSSERFAQPKEAAVAISDIECTGSGSVLPINDAFVPEHQYRICTAYDDLYNQTPERILDTIERLGYRKIINHYVGMSHFPALGSDGLVDPAQSLCTPARRWHESFARLAAERQYIIIWSLSFELLDELCPDSWKQRAWDGLPAQTGYTPASTLLSPAVSEAIDYLGKVALAFVQIGMGAGLPARLQLGEPWWWVRGDQAICLYDQLAAVQLPPHEAIRDVRFAHQPEINAVLDAAGAMLSAATSKIVQAVRAGAPDVTTHLLAYLPSIVRQDAPELIRANLPVGWAKPAFDVLQLEDYEWITAGREEHSRTGLALAGERLGYGVGQQHYLAGYAAEGLSRSCWDRILSAARRQRSARAAEVFIWALPQITRDDLTIFEGEEEVDAFRDVNFPIELGASAWVEPRFSTSIATGASGFEFRNVNWEQARLRFDVAPGVRSITDLQNLLSFFRSMRGNAVAFRFRDEMDYSSSGMSSEPGAADIQLGIGDGATTRYPLIKTYGEGEERRITQPIASSVRVSIGGEELGNGWTLSALGVIEFADPPETGAIVAAGFLFDVPVRFEDEQIRVSRKTYLAGESFSIPLIEVREG